MSQTWLRFAGHVLLTWAALSCGDLGTTSSPAIQPDPGPLVPGSPTPAPIAPRPRSPETTSTVPAAVMHEDPPAEPTRGFSHADTNPTNDNEVGPPPPISDCEDRLTAAGIRYKSARIGVGRKRDGVYTCGAEQVVRYRRGPGDIRYSTSPLVSCPMALALADFETVVQQEAQRTMGTRVVQIDHLGTYNCRQMAAYDLISEHSFANAIDLRRFHLANGETVSVLKDFNPQQPSPTASATLFLRRLANRLYDEDVFSVVVTPFFDRLHRNHIHVDLARYRVDGSR